MSRLTILASLFVATQFGTAANSHISLSRDKVGVQVCCDIQALDYRAPDSVGPRKAVPDLGGGRFALTTTNHDHQSCFAPPPTESTVEAALFQ